MYASVFKERRSVVQLPLHTCTLPLVIGLGVRVKLITYTQPYTRCARLLSVLVRIVYFNPGLWVNKYWNLLTIVVSYSSHDTMMISQYMTYVTMPLHKNPWPRGHQIYNSNNRSLIIITCLLYTSPSPRDLSTSRMPSSA